MVIVKEYRAGILGSRAGLPRVFLGVYRVDLHTGSAPLLLLLWVLMLVVLVGWGNEALVAGVHVGEPRLSSGCCVFNDDIVSYWFMR